MLEKVNGQHENRIRIRSEKVEHRAKNFYLETRTHNLWGRPFKTATAFDEGREDVMCNGLNTTEALEIE